MMMDNVDPEQRIVPWTTKIVSRLIGPIWLRHFMLWQIGLLLLIILARITDGSLDNVILASACAMVGFIMTYVPCHVSSQIEMFEKKWRLSPLSDNLTVDWIEEGKRVTNFRANIKGPMMMVPIICYFYYWTDFFSLPEMWFGSTIANTYWIVYWTFVMLCGGWCTSMVIKVMKLPNVMVFDENNPPSPWEHHMQPLRILSSIFFMVAIYGSLIIMCIMVIILYFPLEINIILISLAGICGVIDLFAFIYPQWGVHQLLKQYKEYHFREISPSVENALFKVTKNPTMENLEHFENLASMYDRINDFEVWPFNMQQLSTVMASVVIPAGIFLFQLFVAGDA